MVSLKRFLNPSDEEVALKKVLSLLLEKMGSGAVRADRGEYDAFLMEMKKIQERVSCCVTPETLFVATGSAIQAMENYNRLITAFLRRQGSELHSIVSMITEAALKMGGDNAQSAQRLQEIGDKFERAGALDDLQALKSHVSDCLNTLKEETQRQKAESDEAIQSLQREIQQR